MIDEAQIIELDAIEVESEEEKNTRAANSNNSIGIGNWQIKSIDLRQAKLTNDQPKKNEYEIKDDNDSNAKKQTNTYTHTHQKWKEQKKESYNEQRSFVRVYANLVLLNAHK